MRDAQSRVVEAISRGVKPLISVKLINSDKTFRWLDGSDFIVNTLKFRNETSSDSSFDVGDVIISSFTFSLNNFDKRWDGYNFSGNIIEAYVQYDIEERESLITEDTEDAILTEWGEPLIVELDPSLQTIRLGEYYLVRHKNVGRIINCEAYDKLILMDQNEADITISSSITAFGVVQQLANARGIVLANVSIPNGDTVITSLPDRTMTERELLSYVMQICGCFARIDSEGRLYVGWYDFSDTHEVTTLFSKSLYTSDVVFSGIHITGEDNLDYSYGSDTNLILEIANNPLINSTNAPTIAANIARNLIGVRFCAGSIKCLSNPLYEAGDVLLIDDDGTDRIFPITSVTYTLSLQEEIRCGALEEEIDDLRPSNIAVTENRVTKRIDKKISTVQANFEAFSMMLGSSFGLYHTEEVLSDGSTIYYLHDQETLAESSTVWKATANAFAVTNDYNAENPDASPWTAGVDKNGNMIAQVLTAIGINVEWINLDGILTDSQHTNWWNLTTGEFHIEALSGYTTTQQHASDLESIGQSIQNVRDYAEDSVSTLRTDAQAMASAAEQNAKAYADDEIGDLNDAWEQDFTAYQTVVSNQFSVLSNEFSSQIEQTKVEVTSHYFVPNSFADQWTQLWRYTSQNSLISRTTRNGRECICLDGTGLLAYNSSYRVWWKLNFDGAGSAKLSFDFELDEIAEGENLAKQTLIPFFYYPTTQADPLYAGGSLYLTITDGVQHVTLWGGSEITPVDGVYSATVTKAVSATDTQEELRIFFVPGHKLYIYDTQFTMTSDAYTDSSVSLIQQKTDSIQLQIEQMTENAKADFIPSDFATDLDPWFTGETADIVKSSTFGDIPCVEIDGSIASSDPTKYSNTLILYGINLTQPGTYTFQFTYASDAAVPNNLVLGQFQYGTVNPDESWRESVPVVLIPASNSQFKTKTAAANEPMVYTGKFTIPLESSVTHNGTTYTAPTDMRPFSMQGTEIGTCALLIYLPPGDKGYIYDFSVLGTATEYAKSVLSVARAEIATEVTRATNAETVLDSRITQTENSIASEISARQADYQTLSSAITQTAQAIETKVSKGDIASTINQTAQSVQISASKIDLAGYVTISSLGSGGTTAIDGSRITTGTISAERIELGDTTNYSNLNNLTYKKYGFTQYTSGTDIWYQLTNSRRDYALSGKYTVNGAEKYRVKCTIFTNAMAITENGGSTVGYIGVGIGLFCGRGNGTWFSYPKTTMAKATSSSGATLTIDEIVTLHADARTMSVYLHTEGWGSYSGTIRVKDLTVTRAATAELIVDGAITANKIAANAIEVGKIKDGAISTAKIADNAVTTAKIPSSAITTVKIADGAISAGKIAANAVVADKIAANAVTAAKINASAVTADKIASNAVTAEKISASAVTVGKIADGAVSQVKIANGAVNADKIAANAVTAAKINASAVTTDKLAASAVTAGKIAANAVTADKINAGAITVGKIADGAISSAKIASGAVSEVKIANGAVTAGKVAANAVTADKIKAGAVNADKLAANAVTAAKIAANAVTADKINAGAVTAGKIAAGAITADKIAANAINGKTITGATIQTATSGARILMDTSSSVKGYNGSTLVNILNMSQSISSAIQMTIDAKNQLNIRTPKVAVTTSSYGTGGGTATVTRTGDTNYVSDVSKSWDGAFEVYVNVRDGDWNTWDMYCTLPVFLNVKYSKFHTIHGMQTTNETVRTNKI